MRGIFAAVMVLFSGCAIGPQTDTPTIEPAVPPEPILAAPDTAGGFASHTWDFEPEMVSMDEPQYPDKAREAGLEGTVLCWVYIDATGRVIKASIRRAVDPALDEAAILAARTAVFKPALRKDGSTVATWMVVPIEFKLH